MTSTPRPGARASITTPTDREIRIERIFRASREQVWRALTDPALLSEWWAPNGKRLEIERMEVRRGGHWRFVEHGAKGADGFEGRYREVTPPERLVYSFEWDGMPGHVVIETVTLEDLGDRMTLMVATMLCHTAEERDGMLHAGMEGAVNQQYDVLERLLASDGPTPTTTRGNGA